MRGDFSEFRQQLLKWFRREGRVLPWRENPSLYKTTVSEFMLQQTQVETVLPYFKAWMSRFPDFASLASAAEPEVLKKWEGLGYYSRARNLHKLAKSIVEMGLPEDFDSWLQRPGIGPYTAAAISSISQGIPEPVIDGNVIRVLSRLENDTRPIPSSTQARSRVLGLARKLIDPDAPGDFNEALMELGAMICKKAKPACLLCPVRGHCRAVAEGTPESIPVIVRKASVKREVSRLWSLQDGHLLLEFYPLESTRLAGMAELPLMQSTSASKPVLVRSRGISSERIRESIFAFDPAHPEVDKLLSKASVKWVPVASLDTVPLSGPHKRWIQHLMNLKTREQAD